MNNELFACELTAYTPYELSCKENLETSLVNDDEASFYEALLALGASLHGNTSCRWNFRPLSNCSLPVQKITTIVFHALYIIRSSKMILQKIPVANDLFINIENCKNKTQLLQELLTRNT